jgi:cell cycle sensor histidine kinase DivJ
MADNYRPFQLELVRAEEQQETFTLLLRENDEIAELRDELAAANEAAASAEVAKGRFLAVVSHELRTPLNAIIGFSDMLLHEMFGGFKDPRQKEYVGLVRDSGQHLLAVVTSILDVSRIEAGAYATEPEPFRFIEAVEMCQSMMQLQANAKNIDLQAQIAPDAGEINADRRAVQQILINLVSNAVKFTPDGGDVVVGAKRIGSRLHFWVSDTGIGIAEEDFENLGKPFMQIQNDYTRRFEGTGLGLSLVKGLVALHDGTMSIESMLGEGTTVTISLPVSGPKGRSRDKNGGVLAIPAVKAKGDAKGDRNGSLRKTA